MKRTTTIAATLLAFAGVYGCGDSKSGVTGPDPGTPGSPRQGSWRGSVAPGTAVEIKGINGDVRASASTGSEVVVSWTKQGRHDDPSLVRVEVVRHADGVTLCAVYPDVPGMDPNECQPGLGGTMHVENNDVEVTFTVTLPDGVDFVGRTIAGDISAVGIGGSAFGYAIGGDIELSASGVAGAVAINGSIRATVGLADWERDLAFTTMQGSVHVEIPANTNAVVRAMAPNGTISSDFPLTDSGLGSMNGTLGAGGPRLTLSTGSGNITLERGQWSSR